MPWSLSGNIKGPAGTLVDRGPWASAVSYPAGSLLHAADPATGVPGLYVAQQTATSTTLAADIAAGRLLFVGLDAAAAAAIAIGAGIALA